MNSKGMVVSAVRVIRLMKNRIFGMPFFLDTRLT
jgi:hypothetical protein